MKVSATPIAYPPTEVILILDGKIRLKFASGEFSRMLGNPGVEVEADAYEIELGPSNPPDDGGEPPTLGEDPIAA